MKTVAAGKGGPSSARWLWLRRCSQLAFLALFLILFVNTDYNGTDQLDQAVNIFFRFDPFLAACVMLGIKGVVVLMLPSLALLLASLIFGRAFCGWLCPLGTLLDLVSRVMPKKPSANRTLWPRLPLSLLLFSLVAALGGFAAAGFFDPFSLLVRGLAQAVYPMFHLFNVELFSFTYGHLPQAINQVTEPLYQFLQATVLPAGSKVFHLASLSLAMLLAVLFFEGLHRRFFCRNVCPLGAMLGTVARVSPLSGRGGSEACGSCRLCAGICRMGAIDEGRAIARDRCNLCYSCVTACPRQVIEFSYRRFSATSTPGPAISLSRRRFVSLVLLGVTMSAVKRVEAAARVSDPLLIRPPGALAETEFLSRCVRCAECIQVCIGNALHPTLLQAGMDGMFSPILAARVGYCEFNCTLCGQVCPTGAITALTREEKHRFKIGHAWFDHDTCLPYVKSIPCMVCEEHCPTPEKAIRFKEVMVTGADGQTVILKQPYVVDELCIGCGICETKCPLPGRAAIYITAAGEHRHGHELPWRQGGYGG